jgi:glyoxylate/hydroxypyruvate reductase A
MTKIALCVELNPAQQERLRRGIGAYELVIRTGDSHQADCLLDCEIVFGNPPADWLKLAEKLRWVQLESVGFGEYTHLDWARLSQSLTLTNLAGFFAQPVAETALAGLLAMTRGIGRLVRLQGSATWEGHPIRTQLRLLQGAKVVMVGFGAINQRLAELLVPFGCHITPIRRNSPIAELDAALIDADILVCTAPDTPETRSLFSAARLARLPARAIFANFGRGSIVDEMALATALQTGRLAGAVLDVTRDEPLPADHPFWTCPNILLTQHSGGGSADERDRKIDHFLDNLSRYRHGEALSGTVDFERGY